ncbi:ribonuclease H, partial [Trifolium pratense]
MNTDGMLPFQFGGNSKRPTPSFRDMVMGQQNVTAPKPKKDLYAANLAEIQYEGGDPAKPMVHIADSVFDGLCDPWKDALVVKLLGKNIGFNTLKDRLTRLWKLTSGFDMLDINNGFYMIKFDLESDKIKVVDGGPWMVFDHYLRVQSWSPEFVSPSAKIDRTMVWIRFPGLNVVFYDESVLLAIAAAVGVPIKVDPNTLDVRRGRFARVCVEIDLNKPVIGKVWIKGHWYRVEYEGLHRICFKCGCYGHLGRNCKAIPQSTTVITDVQEPRAPMNNPTSLTQAVTPVAANANQGIPVKESTIKEPVIEHVVNDNVEGNYGDWLIVKRKPRKSKKVANTKATADPTNIAGAKVKGNGGKNVKAVLGGKQPNNRDFGISQDNGGPSKSHSYPPQKKRSRQDIKITTNQAPQAAAVGVQHGNLADQSVNTKIQDSASIQHVIAKKNEILSSSSAPHIYDLGNGLKSTLNLKHVSNSRYELLLDEDEAATRLATDSNMVPETQSMEESMDFSILSWNIRGALGNNSKRHVRDLVKGHHPTLFFIFETRGSFDKVDKFWNSLGYKPIFIQEARGFAGGYGYLVLLSNLCITYLYYAYTTLGSSSGFEILNFRTLVDDVDWRLSFPDSLAELLPAHDSDHNPILISCMKAKSKRSNIFHFQAAWLSHPDYESLVDTTWNQAEGDVVSKLSIVQTTSLRFNKEVFGNIYKNKKLLEARIKGVHLQLDSCQSSDLISFEKSLQLEYNKVLAQEEMMWYQKSREKWVKFGNKNTRFFHIQSVIRSRRNKIASLQIDGIWCSDEEVLRRSALAYFQNLFQQDISTNPNSLQFTSFPQISTDLYENLGSPPSMEEIKSALFSMDSYKAPGPDGFQPIFFKRFWNLVAPDVFQLVSSAFQSGTIAPKLAETLIVPIPKEKVQSGHWKPVKISRNGPAISHLFFADDCLLFTQAKSSQARLVKEVLCAFCHASGLKVNIQKSRFMVSTNMSRIKVAKFESIVHFSHNTHLGKYLGFPMLSGRMRNSDFSFIMDRINNRLNGWKSKLLSRAGRVTLAQSVISAMPIYTMQNLWIPQGVCDKIDASVRQFIWGNNHCHWVKWDTVTQPRSKGGLGIHVARKSNIALLGKHIWDLIHHPDKLWVQLLADKYLRHDHILHATKSQGASCVWNYIVKAVEVLKPGFKFRIGKGDVSLWYDNWLDYGCLCNSVPYVHISESHLLLKDVYNQGNWLLHSLTTQIPDNLKLHIQSIFINNDSPDILIWGFSNFGVYSAKSGYHWLSQHYAPPLSI